MSSKKKIHLLFCGGTIAMARKADGLLAPALDLDSLLNLVPELSDIAQISYELVINIDSTNMDPSIWTDLAKKIYKNYQKYDGFVVTHGTDTMAYTASAISFAIQGLTKPIVFTGSQKPPQDLASDARNNLVNAVKVAALGIPEVCIVFGTEILRGNRSQKKSETSLNAFWSPVAQPLGMIALEPQIYLDRIFHLKSKLRFQPKFESRVMFYQMFPGLKNKYVEMALNNGSMGMILNSFGAGNVPTGNYSLIPALKKAFKKNMPVVITTQCVEGSAQMLLYETGYAALKAGAISALDMTSEAAVTKLMWILAQTRDLKKIKEMLQKNLVGEISN